MISLFQVLRLLRVLSANNNQILPLLLLSDIAVIRDMSFGGYHRYSCFNKCRINIDQRWWFEKLYRPRQIFMWERFCTIITFIFNLCSKRETHIMTCNASQHCWIITKRESMKALCLSLKNFVLSLLFLTFYFSCWIACKFLRGLLCSLIWF